MNSTSTTRPTTALRLHPLQDRLPAPDEKSFAWQNFVRSVRDQGIIQPLVITDDGQIMDGRWRWRAAQVASLDLVPVVIRPAGAAADLMTASLLARKLFPRGTAAFLALCLQPDLISTARSRRENNLLKRKGNGDTYYHHLSARLGVSDRTIDDAVRVFKLFQSNPDFRAKYEPLLVSGEMGLATVIHAAAVSKAGAPRTKGKTSLDHVSRTCEAITKLGKHWTELDRSGRVRARQLLKAAILRLPDELREAAFV